MRAFAQAVALGRAAFGGVWLADPDRINAKWLGGGGVAPEPTVLSRSAAARDLGLGIGAFAATRAGNGAPWFAAHAVADAADLLGTLMARDHLPERGVRQTVLVAGGSLAACLVCVRYLATED